MATTNAQYCAFFWNDDQANPGKVVCTMCDCNRKKPSASEGYTNLMQHLNTQHKEFEAIYAREKTTDSVIRVGGMLKYLKKQASVKAENIWEWIDWILEDNLPFEFVESNKARENSKLQSISANTLKKYMTALLHKVEGKLEALLKALKTFGLITDGWTIDSDHYMALFATFVEKDMKGNDVVREYLLSCNVQEDITDDTPLAAGLERENLFYGLTAEDMFDHIVSVLVEVYHLEINVDNIHEFIEFIAGDNVAVQRALCTRIGVPLGGCESHRLQLAVYDFLGSEEKKNTAGVVTQEASADNAVIRKLDLLMGELTTLKNAGILRQGFLEGEIMLRPQRRIKAKWASLVGMLLKWERLREPIARVAHRFPQSVIEKIPSAEEKVRLEEITRALKDFESVSKGLQGGGDNRINRYGSRCAFDALLATHDTDERPLDHLHRNSAIVNNRAFENAIVKIQGNAEGDLTNIEKAAVAIFKIPTTAAPVAAATPPPPQLSFFQRAQQESELRKRARIEKSSYRSTEHVSATSNICERLFSLAKLIMTHLRKHMDPDTLNMILFLKANKTLWAEKCIILMRLLPILPLQVNQMMTEEKI